jgi:hypothetical protein
MYVPTYQEVLALIASGAFVVPLLEFLKKLPGGAGEFFDKNAWIIAPLLSALAPILAQGVTTYIPSVDPWLWTALYAFGVYGANQLTYHLAKKAGKV